MKKTFLMLSLALAVSAMIAACGGKPKLMTAAEMNQKVDSMYQAQVTTLGPEMDQACELKFESLVTAAVDSILAANDPAIQ